MRSLLSLMVLILWAGFATAQDTTKDVVPAAPDRSSTGGATTLEDILARQRGETVDSTYRSSNTGPAQPVGATPQLGTRGAASDSDIFRALRYGTADVTLRSNGPAAKVMIQDSGMWWLKFRAGPLSTYGAYLLGGVLALLALFYLIRGKIRIDGDLTGRKILRFSGIERFGHWLFAGSFMLLGISGLISLFGRKILIPTFGHEAFSTLAIASKWIHNNVAWAFMAGLILIILNWTLHNIPNRHDLKWLLVGGGLFSKGVHPPARKFNAGQKMIFWGCVVLGLSISASGLSLLFPFQIEMYGSTFALLNDIGVSGWFGFAPLPEILNPQQEMQYSQIWHTTTAFIFMAMIFAHIYLGSIGMEGAFDAVNSGKVEEQWAKEHHSLWVQEVRAKEAKNASPAE